MTFGSVLLAEVGTQILPARVYGSDEGVFLGASPSFDLLFATDRIANVMKDLDVDQAKSLISTDKCVFISVQNVVDGASRCC